MASRSSTDIYAETLAVFDGTPDPAEPLTTPEVAERLGEARRTVYKRLSTLLDRGRLRTKGVGAKARVWWVPVETAERDGGVATSSVTTRTPTGRRRGLDDGDDTVGDRDRANGAVDHATADDGRAPAVGGDDHASAFETAGARAASTILETVPDGVFALDPTDRFAFVNDAYCELTGYGRETLLGAHATLVTSESVNATANEVSERLSAGDLDDAVIELDLERADGTVVPVESRFAHYAAEDGIEARCGVVRDVSDRVARERELESAARWNRTLVDNFPNGVVSLFDRDLRYRLVGGQVFEELDRSSADLEGRRLEAVLSPEIAVQMAPHFRAVFDGESREFEVTVGERVREFHTLPVRDDRGEIVVGLSMSQDVTARRRHEWRLEDQRERLTRLNHLADAVLTTTHAAVDQSSRLEIERLVCESLAGADTYAFAWIAEVDQDERRLVPRAEAGVEGYLDDLIADAVDPAAPLSEGPVGRAITTGRLQVTDDVFEDADFERWREYAERIGYRSVAAIPIRHEGTLFGILGLYSNTADAFDDASREILGRLGDIVGHAIASAGWKQALMSENRMELQFQIRDFFDALGVAVSTADRITFDRIVPLGDGDVLAYGTSTEAGIGALEALVAGNPTWHSVAVVERMAEHVRFVVRVTEPPTVSRVAEHGGYLVQSIVEDGDSYMTVHLPASVDVRRLVEELREAFPNLVMVARRRVTGARASPDRRQHPLASGLTDRQRHVLEAAYEAGYFDRPRASTGVEVADTLGVSPSTFHQHLRVATAKLLESAIGSPRPRPP